MSHLRPILTVLTGALIAVAAPALANASDFGPGYTAADAPLGGPTELRIDLKGRVAARCDLTTPPQISRVLPVHRTGHTEAGFKVDCNTPFLMRVRSAEGGFASVAPMAGYEALAPYEVSVELRTDEGVHELGWCNAAALTDAATGDCDYAPNSATRGWSSGDETAIDQTGTVRLRWQEDKTGAPLLGDYRDTIVIELEVRS